MNSVLSAGIAGGVSGIGMGGIYSSINRLANTKNRDKILYDINPIKKVEDVVKSTSNSAGGEPYPTGAETIGQSREGGSDSPNTSVPQSETGVNSNYMQNEGENTPNAEDTTPDQSPVANVVPGINRETEEISYTHCRKQKKLTTALCPQPRKRRDSRINNQLLTLLYHKVKQVSIVIICRMRAKIHRMRKILHLISRLW